MLFIYMPNEQTPESAHAIQQIVAPRIKYDMRDGHFDQKDGISALSFTTSWCRELTIDALNYWTQDLPPGKLDIFGIRKHGEEWPSQPMSALGMIDKRDSNVNALFYNLFQFITEMLSHIFETNTTELYTINSWLRTFSFSHPGRIKCRHSIRCLLNRDTNLVPVTPLWTTDEMYGTLFNIPSKWACSSAVMSYLLYLPRLWGAFHEKSPMKDLIKVGKLRQNGRALTNLSGGIVKDFYHPMSVEIGIWRNIASRLMLPLWFTHFGREDFWTFTYLLICEGIAAKEGSPRIPGLLEALKRGGNSGFVSWLHWYRCCSDSTAPSWVNNLYEFLRERGYYAVLYHTPITKYV